MFSRSVVTEITHMEMDFKRKVNYLSREFFYKFFLTCISPINRIYLVGKLEW